MKAQKKADKLNPFFADFHVPHPEVTALNNQLRENQDVFIEFAELIDKRILVFDELIANGEVIEEYYGKYERLMSERKSDEQVELMRRSHVHHKRLDHQFQKIKVMLAAKTIDAVQNFVEFELGSAKEATERYNKVRNDCNLAENKLSLFQGSKKYDEYKKEFDDLQSQFTMIQDLTIKVLADKMGASEKLMDELMVAYWTLHYDFFVSGSTTTNEIKQSIEHLVRTGGAPFDVTTITVSPLPTITVMPSPDPGPRNWATIKTPHSPVVPHSEGVGFRQAALPALSRRSPPAHGAGPIAMFANARVAPATEKQPAPQSPSQPRRKVLQEEVQQQLLSLKGRPLPVPSAASSTTTASLQPSTSTPPVASSETETVAETPVLGTAPCISPRDQTPSKPLMKRRSRPDILDPSSKQKVFGTAIEALWARDNSVHVELLHLIKYLEEYGHTDEQIFEKKGNPDILGFMTNTIDSGKTLIGTVLPSEVRTVSDLLVIWLELLPGTVYTSEDGMYKSIVDALTTNKVTKKIDGMISIVRKLPLPNRIWLRLISRLIEAVAKKKAKSPRQIPDEVGELSNKLGPACLRPEKGHEWHASQMLKSMTLYSNSFFPEGCAEDDAITRALISMPPIQQSQPSTPVVSSLSASTPVLPSYQATPTPSSLSSSTSALPTVVTATIAPGPLSLSLDAIAVGAPVAVPVSTVAVSVAAPVSEDIVKPSKRNSDMEDCIFEVKILANEINAQLKRIQEESLGLKNLELGVPIIKRLKCYVPKMEELRNLLEYQSVVDRSSFATPVEDKLARLRNTISIITSDCILLINEVGLSAESLDMQKLSEILGVLQSMKSENF